jgi:prepilin signal peptidase PulO-like enzyme (type II secretory pathway)
LYYLGRLFSKFISRNRELPIDEEALGFGDVYMAGAIGFLTGFPYILPALLVSIVLGGLVSAFVLIITLVKKTYEAFRAIPYGPFIIIGGIINQNTGLIPEQIRAQWCDIFRNSSRIVQ